MVPCISICIPAYKRTEFLKRLLDSIAIQTFRDFEVIVTDDSPSNEVEEVTEMYKSKFKLNYYKNENALGTPANWNECIGKANGTWIKLMHDDDWFSTEKSLGIFVSHLSPQNKFVFSAYKNIHEDSKKGDREILLSYWGRRNIDKHPDILLLQNLIGPPSVTVIHNSVTEIYDTKLKWRVDSDLYARVIKKEKKYVYINNPLINIGISESQVTQSCINNPVVELPEAFVLIKKHGLKSLANIRIYDSWWRLLRNMQIKNEAQLRQYVDEEWPKLILAITDHLAHAPSLILKYGIVSKIYMLLSFCKNFSILGKS